MNLRVFAFCLLAALPGRAADAPALPLRDAIAGKKLAITIRGNGRDQLTIAARNPTKEAVALDIPAGLVGVSDAGAVVTLRAVSLPVPAGQSAEAVLPVVARSAKNACAEHPFGLTNDTVPALAPLLAYAATRNDFPKPTAQLVALALLEDVTFAKWQEFLGAQRPVDATAAPLPAEVATAIDALGVLREIAPARKFALATDDELKVRALRNPIARAKAMQLYGLALPEGVVPPDLGQLLHTKPGDNCPICRMRAQMQDAGNGL